MIPVCGVDRVVLYLRVVVRLMRWKSMGRWYIRDKATMHTSFLVWR